MKVPVWIVPALVVAAATIGTVGADLFVAPSVEKTFSTTAPGASSTTVKLVVSGLRCVDTAQRVADQLTDLPGVVRFLAYASKNEAVITFDRSRTNVKEIRDAIEAPAYDPSSGEVGFGLFKVLEIDGAPAR